MKRVIFILCYFAIILTTFGLLFKTMHWQGANIMLIFGIALLNLGFLPTYMLYRYKSAD